jgi:hypothetical protein
VATATRSGPPENRIGSPTSNGNGKMHLPTLAPPKRRVRLPELAVGLLVTVMFALGAVLWHLNSTSKVPALAVTNAVARGDVIAASDLRIVYVASDDQLARMTAAESATVVGRVALVDLAPGTLLTPAVVADAAALKAGDGVAGLALDAGQYPALGLAPGDRVNVVASGGTAATTGTSPGAQVIARGATVFRVEDLASDRKLVSILTSEADAEAVAAAAGSGTGGSGAGGLRLVLVAP